MATVCAALPWLDQLHNLIASLYVGGINNRCAGHNVMVQIGKDVSLENPLVSYAGVGEIERAFRGMLHCQNDVKTVLECVNVEASTDSIAGGEALNQHDAQQGGTSSPSLISIPSTIMSPSLPNVEVTYKLSQQYGTFFSVCSLLVVTVQVKRGESAPTKVRNICLHKVAVLLATSGVTTTAASTVAVATCRAGPASVALAMSANKIAEVTATGQSLGNVMG